VRYEPLLPYARFWPAIPVRLPECDVCGESTTRREYTTCPDCDEVICNQCQREPAGELGTCNSDECMAAAVRRLKKEKL
jgi:hypothetical protein